MIFLFGGLSLTLLLVGSGVAVYRKGKPARESEFPLLTKPSRKKKLIEQALIEWTSMLDDELGSWLQALDSERRRTLLREVNAYCKAKNFEPSWLVNNQIEDRELQNTWTTALIYYLQSQRKIYQAQDDLDSYIALVDLLQHPNRFSNKEKLQAVYLQLVNQDIISTKNVDMLLGKDRDRWKKAANAIAATSRTHRKQVNIAVREHVLGIPPGPNELPSSSQNEGVLAMAANN